MDIGVVQPLSPAHRTRQLLSHISLTHSPQALQTDVEVPTDLVNHGGLPFKTHLAHVLSLRIQVDRVLWCFFLVLTDGVHLCKSLEEILLR